MKCGNGQMIVTLSTMTLQGGSVEVKDQSLGPKAALDEGRSATWFESKLITNAGWLMMMVIIVMMMVIIVTFSSLRC